MSKSTVWNVWKQNYPIPNGQHCWTPLELLDDLHVYIWKSNISIKRSMISGGRLDRWVALANGKTKKNWTSLLQQHTYNSSHRLWQKTYDDTYLAEFPSSVHRQTIYWNKKKISRSNTLAILTITNNFLLIALEWRNLSEIKCIATYWLSFA